MRIRVLAHPGGQGPDERVRRREPLTFGVPLPRGAVTDRGAWTFGALDGPMRFAQVRALDRWADGSARWVLVDAQADLDGRAAQEFALDYDPSSKAAPPASAIAITKSSSTLVVDTGAARFQVRAHGRAPFDAIDVGGQPAISRQGGGLTLVDAAGAVHDAQIRSVEVEEQGPLRSVVLMRGAVGSGRAVLDLTIRAHVYAGHSTVRLLLALTNPHRAQHRGGFWDLGDSGSILVKDLSLGFVLAATDGDVELWGSPEIGGPWTKFETPFELYQDSSGGDNWQSLNHLNRERRVPNTFRGYRLRAGGRAQTGLRATPAVALARGAAGVAVTTPHFWQNFPKAIEVGETALTMRLFPGQYGDVHEIQGGEQKTHELFVSFGPDGVSSIPLAWCRARTTAGAAPEWCLQSAAVPFLAPLGDDHAALVNSAIEGPNRFELKRELIDEYGWRHFGEVYGDHEAVRHKGATPLVSHYNNQYDPINGFAYQFLRTGDPRWWAMMSELATHVVDVDLYHTTKDKSAYSGGMFWHTYHYGDADTATHRTFPRAGKGHVHGGGPSAGHNYTTGLMMHYFLTGSEASREAVIQLARYVINIDDGRRTVLKLICRSETGLATLSARGYYGPGRGAANSLNALLDGYRVSGSREFFDKAEEFLRRSIHPSDDIASRDFHIPEERWFYTMFLQSLGKYLHYKLELDQTDDTYVYGVASLLHYARWMAEHEHPYFERPERLRYPTETWSAQDARKSDALYFAARHASSDERRQFLERAQFFYQSSVSGLRGAATRGLARPVVIMTTSGYMHSWIGGATLPEPRMSARGDFGKPGVFIPQRDIAERRVKWLAALGAVTLLATAWLTWFR